MQQMSQREQEVRELSQRANDIRGVIASQREEKNMIEPLVAKGSAPKLELLQLERTIKEKQTELNSVELNLPRARSAVGEAKARIADLTTSAKAQAQTELSAKLIEMNEIKERLGALKDRKKRTEIKSPVSGTIQEIKVKTIGGVVRPGEDIIKIVPKDDQLIVEAQVKPSDRAFIYPGQKAVVKITAYDFSIYGGLDGEVLDISADTIKDEKGNFFYRVRLRTYETELKRKGKVLPIIPGMVATADILTGQKTVMQYLLKPFVKTLDNAFNER
jgi:adhesin transport system membrane fusion protein